MSSDNEHLDIKALMAEGRKGWFFKEDEELPEYKYYRTSCRQGGRGFFGPNFGAHHIIPQEAVVSSTEKFDPDYVYEVKYITPYILNRPTNMMGLPSFWSYDAYYESLQAESDAKSEYPGNSVRWRDSFSVLTSSWIQKYGRYRQHTPGRLKRSPENYPIHAPNNWGHPKYTEKVSIRLEQQVWKVIGKKKSDHISKKAFDSIQAQLQSIEQSFYQRLTSRGSTSPELWERRKNPEDNGWYKPYTMTDIKKNPIWG